MTKNWQCSSQKVVVSKYGIGSKSKQSLKLYINLFPLSYIMVVVGTLFYLLIVKRRKLRTIFNLGSHYSLSMSCFYYLFTNFGKFARFNVFPQILFLLFIIIHTKTHTHARPWYHTLAHLLHFNFKLIH